MTIRRSSNDRLLVTVLGTVAGFTVFVYLPVLVAPVASGTVLSWVLVGSGLGQGIGTTVAGRATDRLGPAKVRALSLAGTAVVLAALAALGVALRKASPTTSLRSARTATPPAR